MTNRLSSGYCESRFSKLSSIHIGSIHLDQIYLINEGENMATLRVQKLSSDRGIGLGELSSLTGIDEETLEKYASEDIEINQETAKHLQKIAAKLDIPLPN